MSVEVRESRVVANGLAHHVLQWIPAAPRDVPPVVLCHGFLDIAWSWDRVARRLAEAGRTCVAFDWRGHGETDWVGAGGYYYFTDYSLDLDTLLPQLTDAPDVHLVGHSMGGTAVTMYAAARPERVRALVVIEGIGPPDRPAEIVVERLRSFLEGVRRTRERPIKPMKDVAEALTRMRIQNPTLPDELGLFLAEKSTKPADGGGRTWCFDPLHRTTSPQPFRADQLRALLAAIRAPMLYVGATDGFHPSDEDQRLAQVRSLERATLEGTGHMMHWTAPERLAGCIESFLMRH